MPGCAISKSHDTLAFRSAVIGIAQGTSSANRASADGDEGLLSRFVCLKGTVLS